MSASSPFRLLYLQIEYYHGYRAARSLWSCLDPDGYTLEEANNDEEPVSNDSGNT